MEQPRAINNPMLVGSMELLKADNSTKHRDFFLQELLKAHLLTPATVTPKPEKDESGMLRMLPDSQIQFPMLGTQEGMRYFMAFTDIQELKKWVKSPEEDQQLFVLGFQNFASMVKSADSQCDGFAINPGGANIRVTRKMIDTIQEALASEKPQTEGP
ncbi:MAG: SseB family protein [Acetatifactor sp.]|nr:SseB family protein [Acetatifactor sp.]